MSQAVRLAAPGDAPALALLLGILFEQEAEFAADPARQAAGLARIIAAPDIGRVLLAGPAPAPLGMVVLLYTVSTALGGRAALLEDMVVAPLARGQGLGAALIRAAIAQARQDGARRITLLTDADNRRAQAFYRREGFQASPMTPYRLALD